MQPIKKNAYLESSAPPSQIDELYSFIRSIRRYPAGYRAIHLHLSVLDRLHKQPHHRRTIATAFNKLVHANDGKLFWLRNFDLFFICKDCPQSAIEAAKIDALRSIIDSPVIKAIINESRDDDLCDWYDLTTEYSVFYTLVENLFNSDGELDIAQSDNKKNSLESLILNSENIKKEPQVVSNDTKIQKKTERTLPDYDTILSKNVLPPMGPMQLDKLERNVLNIDIFGLISEQNICVIVDKSAPEVIFTKRYISQIEVNKALLPGFNIAADKWLFQRLTKTFDLKIMQSLVDNKNFPTGVLSINMNVSTIFTKKFDGFIVKQKQLSKNPLIVEIPLFDIMSNLTEYFKAQEKLTKLGCKICISKMDIQSLYILNRELINVDFIKIHWHKSYKRTLGIEEKDKIINAIKAQGKMRVVLSDCDSQEALEFGNQIGIVIYQGFEVDKLQSLS
jgi:EAL domain-containing protein (putative c-di-GMP-specific phosphodiesterase class I)